ncbi:LysR family transcriptional regulator [Pseudonocardia eucalypti]|uniref:LysR family transcriptional regulator n=1 Tax=Pseudonocardia eucalypti TaxID=648755 RepID=A0ABP9RAC7_9PSEU|nr:DNA-binding transcriptional LysR family regulator [Pseudonocardia eucalypti]
MDSRRLRYLLELARLGSMRAVADALGTTTSTVSQQIAVLGRETGAVLVEPEGRRVRLTPAGRRLAAHAVTILAAIEAAQADLDPGADPAGTVRVSGFATAIRRSLLPVAASLGESHPNVRLIMYEHEPAEALALLAGNDVDLALTYDYNLAPAVFDTGLAVTPLWSTPWGLAVPAGPRAPRDGDTPAVFRAFRRYDWIGNSRNPADERVVRTLSSMAGFEPRLTHEADSLDLVEELILAGFGVGLLPADRPARPGIRLLHLSGPEVRLRAYAVTRHGRSTWPPVTLLLHLLTGRLLE